MLRNSSVLCECSSHCIQHLALHGNPQEYTVNDHVYISGEIGKLLPLHIYTLLGQFVQHRVANFFYIIIIYINKILLCLITS